MAKICKFPKHQNTNKKSMGKVQENKRKLYIQTSTTIREEWKSNNPTERDIGNIRKPLQKNLTKHTKETRNKKAKVKTDHNSYNEAFTEELKIAMKTTKRHISQRRLDTSTDGKKVTTRNKEIYNRIWMEGEIPKSWKSAIITPLLKEGKDVRSYRSVALTNSLCKIFERMINRRLVWSMEKENKTPDNLISES